MLNRGRERSTAPARARRSCAAMTGKTEERKQMRTTTASRLYSAAKEHGDDMQQPPHTSAKPEVATSVPGSRWKLTDGESWPAFTVQAIYRNATHFISQITLKIVG